MLDQCLLLLVTLRNHIDKIKRSFGPRPVVSTTTTTIIPHSNSCHVFSVRVLTFPPTDLVPSQ